MNALPSIRHALGAARYVLALALLGACADEPGDGDGATVRGRVSDGNGSQYTRLGGSGSAEASVRVYAYAIHDDGSREAIGSGSVEADGSFEFDADTGVSPAIVQAVSSDNEVVASAILETTGDGGRVTCTPLDTESSVEAEVLLAMIAQSGSTTSVDPVDLRVRIDSDTAVEVRATYEDQGEDDAEDAIEALAQATLAAQATEMAAWSEAGFETDAWQMFTLGLEASQDYSQALYAETSPQEAWADFTASLSATLHEESGMTDSEQAESEAQGGLAFRLVVQARLDDAIAWEAVQSAAWSEAEVEAVAIGSMFAAADASGEVVDEAEQAGTDLVAGVGAAASTTALVTSYADFQAALVGESTVEGSALGSYLGVDAASAFVLDASIDACVASATAFEEGLDDQMIILTGGVGAIDAHAVAAAVVTAWSTHRATVLATLESDLVASQDAQFATDVTILATTSLRGVQ